MTMSPSVDVKAKITHFLDEIGRVKTRPSKYIHQLYVVSYLAQKIPGERVFTEHQITQLLSMWHTFWNAWLLYNELHAQDHLDSTADWATYKRK